MPIYEYVCSACGRRTEVIHAVSARGPEQCESCGGALRRAMSAPAIVFKGSGWAKKDARAPAAKAAKEGTTGESEAKPASDKAPSGTSDGSRATKEGAKPASESSGGTTAAGD